MSRPTDNIAKCLGDAVDAGRLTREGAERALREVKRIFDENPGVSEGAAMASAAESLTREAALRKRQVALQVAATDRVLRDAGEHQGGIYRGVWAVFGRDLTGKATYSNVEGRAEAVRNIMFGMMSEVVANYRSKNLGLTRDVIGLSRLVREIRGEASGDPIAANAAAGWRKASDFARQQFNAAGGAIAERADWHMPQNFWDADVLRAMGPARFADRLHDLVASGALVLRDFETGGPLSAIRQAEVISNTFERVTSGGLSDLIPGQAGGKKLANSRSDRRAFEWTSADAWLEANRTFGRGDVGIFDVLVGHIDGIANDIAMLEVLGPNPAATARVLIDTAKKAGATETQVHRLENLWAFVNGSANSPVAGFWASLGSGVRQWLASAQLGSAVISGVTDLHTLRQTAAWNGLGANGVMAEYLRLLNPAAEADRKLALRVGLGADGWARRAVAAQRNTFEGIGNTLPARLSDFVMRASGLNAHTQAGKWAFGMEFLGRLADDAGKGFDALDPALRRTFERYGMGAADWDVIRSKGLSSEDGVDLIFPEQMVLSGDRTALRAATRLMEMVNTERGFAILEPGAAERALILGSSKAGTLPGEFWRSATQYKSFPITMMTRHLMRGVSEGGISGGVYLARLMIGLTVFGGLAMQLKQIAQGKDPRDMTAPNFWGAAFLQGGGAGLFGDFFNASTSRAGGSFYMSFVGGPTGGLMDDAIRLTGQNITAITEDRDANWGRDAARFVRRNTPGSSLWYGRLAFDRLMFDQLQAILDPDHGRAWSRTEQRARQETRQEFWWRPGETAPERLPNAGAVMGGGRP